jgi:raffinose/stachyose/melibiose transport system permease protein
MIPVWIVVVNSLKARRDANLLGVGLPVGLKFHLENYRTVFIEGGIARALFNGLLEATASVAIIILLASISAFVIARKKSRFMEFAFYAFIFGLIIPAALIPTFLVLNATKLINTYLGLILVFATYGLPISVFLYTGAVKSIPRELDESALIDGSSSLRMFYRIIFPLLKPVTVTIFIFSFIGAWNDVLIPLFFTGGDKWALPLTIYSFYGSKSQEWNLIFADIVITVSPLVAVYVFAQRYIISGMTAGAVKG